MTVLIVEDNAGIRRVMRLILGGTASEVWECVDGSEALGAYKFYRPDIVLMDVKMPLIDGLTATRRIRVYDPTARIVIVTDYLGEDMTAAALEAGASQSVLKQELARLPEIVLSLAARDDRNH
jgi:CheY-like chemotaxis protein